ncbi:MAG TPA: helix-hairpin-helix domain-containing protein [Bacteroidales bacterium]|nr:helix-hairpin-helix domain-containing protein [Bacteroidales bacterium]
MKFDFSSLRNWFGYSRRERRSSLILLLLIVFVISLRYFVPGKSIPVEYIRLVQDEIIADSISGKIYPENTKPVTRKHVVRDNKVKIVDINRCDTSELIRLPGIGPVLSVRIIKYRNLLGGYYSKEQLREVYGLPPETYEKIKDMVKADTMLIKYIEINTADYRKLSRMPYLERGDVNAILKYRELKGKIHSVSELVENKVISKEKALKVRPYLHYD